MTYADLRRTFREFEADKPKEHLTAHIVFTSDSFGQPYSRLARTYCISSNNKAYLPNMGGYSIYGSALDGTDNGARLENYMADERAPGGWKVEHCYILEHMRDAAAIFSLHQRDQGDGITAFFFGNTTIHAKLQTDGSQISLEAIDGDQVACGQWVDLNDDEVIGYCNLLARALNRERALKKSVYDRINAAQKKSEQQQSPTAKSSAHHHDPETQTKHQCNDRDR